MKEEREREKGRETWKERDEWDVVLENFVVAAGGGG
jgi:hypothetical protein